MQEERSERAVSDRHFQKSGQEDPQTLFPDLTVLEAEFPLLDESEEKEDLAQAMASVKVSNPTRKEKATEKSPCNDPCTALLR